MGQWQDQQFAKQARKYASQRQLDDPNPYGITPARPKPIDIPLGWRILMALGAIIAALWVTVYFRHQEYGVSPDHGLIAVMIVLIVLAAVILLGGLYYFMRKIIGLCEDNERDESS